MKPATPRSTTHESNNVADTFFQFADIKVQMKLQGCSIFKDRILIYHRMARSFVSSPNRPRRWFCYQPTRNYTVSCAISVESYALVLPTKCMVNWNSKNTLNRYFLPCSTLKYVKTYRNLLDGTSSASFSVVSDSPLTLNTFATTCHIPPIAWELAIIWNARHWSIFIFSHLVFSITVILGFILKESARLNFNESSLFCPHHSLSQAQTVGVTWSHMERTLCKWSKLSLIHCNFFVANFTFKGWNQPVRKMKIFLSRGLSWER